jgi:hypothetical protein
MSSYPTPTRDVREAGFLKALETAKDIALDMDIDTLFHIRRKIKRKRHFDENVDNTNVETLSAEKIFRVNYFIHIVDLVGIKFPNTSIDMILFQTQVLHPQTKLMIYASI